MALLNATGAWTGAALQSTASFNAARKGEVEMSPADRDLLRDLAVHVAEQAALPLQAQKRTLWRRHNDLEPTRPLVFCDPENGWNEIIREANLGCSGSLARRWEIVLRKELFWARRLRDDKVVEPFFDVGYTCGEDDWGVRSRQTGGGGGSYVWEPALKEESEVDRLHLPELHIDLETSRAAETLARETFAGLLQVRLSGFWWWSLGLTLDLSLWRGLEQVMYDMMDRPQLVHRLMGILRDGNLRKIEELEGRGLLSSNVDQYVGSGGFGYTGQLPFANGPARTQEMWGFCESQETVGVSPEMFAEFVFPYQLPLLQRFGLNCYGCCEPLDRRWDVVKETPNLRRVSVSSWADLETMASLLEDRYVFSWKPSPAVLAEPAIDGEAIRSGICHALELTRGCRLEIIMKDNHTLGNNPDNAVRWVQIVREEIERQWK